MRSNQARPGPVRRRRRPGVSAAVLLAVVAVATGCAADDPSPAPPRSAVTTMDDRRDGSAGTDVPGTAPTTVVRRPAGTAPPGTAVGPAGTAPPGTNVDRPNRSIEPDVEAPDVTWTANATDHQGDLGLLVAYDCTPDGIEATVWGDGVYTDDSSVCTAAVFEGIITVDQGGRVVIQIVGGRDRYDAATANGITTLPYGRWPGSFWFPGT